MIDLAISDKQLPTSQPHPSRLNLSAYRIQIDVDYRVYFKGCRLHHAVFAPSGTSNLTSSSQVRYHGCLLLGSYTCHSTTKKPTGTLHEVWKAERTTDWSFR